MVDKEQELCKAIGREMIKAQNALRNEDFVFNPGQKEKLDKVIAYAKRLAEANGGTVMAISDEPKYECGGIKVRFVGEITFGDASASMSDFVEAVKLCDGFEVFGTGLDDGSFFLTFYVDNLHIPKSKSKILHIPKKR